MPSDMSGIAIAVVAAGGEADAAAGAATKQPMTSTINMTPTVTLMTRVKVLLMRSPHQWKAVNNAMAAMATARGAAAAVGHKVPRNTAAVSDAYAIVAT